MATTAEDWSIYWRVPVAYGYDSVTDDYYMLAVDSDGKVKLLFTQGLLGLLSHGLLTVAILQAQNTFVTGTVANPKRITDNDTGTAVDFGLDQYAIIPLDGLYTFTQWRQYRTTSNNGDGELKIQYWNGSDWVDWVTFATEDAAGWSNWASADEITTSKLRLLCTVVDTHGNSTIMELEVKY